MNTPRFLIINLVLVLSAAAATRLTNVSIRSTAGSDTGTLIVGFTVAGSGTKPVLVRGIGPSLTSFGVAGAVTDPELRLFDSRSLQLATNDNWEGNEAVAVAASSVGAFPLATSSRDAALLAFLPAGAYSVHVSPKSETGIALVEAYEADQGTVPAQISNLSARSVSGTGASVLTVGFSISGETSKTVLIRAVGPTLGAFGVGDALTNPVLRLFNERGVDLGSNDDWYSGAGWSAAFAAVGAFPLANGTLDAVLLVDLVPGTYTAQASGTGSSVGVALIEIYDVPAPPASSLVLRPVANATPATFPAFPSGANRGVTVPSVRFQMRPQYPFELRRAGVTGEAFIQFVAAADGTVTDAFVVRASDYRFGDAAVAAVRTWMFTPARNAAGQNVYTIMQVPIIFVLDEV